MDKNEKQGFLGRTGGFPGETGCVKRDQKRRGKISLNEINKKQKIKSARREIRKKKVDEQTEIKIRSFPGVANFLTRCWGTASSALEAT